MISSAVAIPEEPQSQPDVASQSTSRKRRQSSASGSSESNKRLHLDKQSSNTSNHGTQSPSAAVPSESFPTTMNGGQAASPLRQSDVRRRQTSSNLEQDKSRNRRLFGALLGTLSQSSRPSKSSAGNSSRREEIESRQRERLKRENEELAEHARRKKEQLDRVRRAEQRRWDREGMRIRHSNLRAAAGFLRTKAEPQLYYKPWELRDFEEDTIKRQIDEADETIQRERDEFDRRQTSENNEPADHRSTHGDENGSRSLDVGDGRQPKVNDDGGRSRDDLKDDEARMDDSSDRRDRDHVAISESSSTAPREGRVKEIDVERPMSKDDDHGGEELELGQEDDVIY
ncbi:uncharacterized protein Z518_04055 [Rhinocladiella mackenziei CBS 650.93]|uniref:Pinin/SDK/MemA protein domain-containing protein n=1 Tax=Rhinocladiella mackenziei CBS 650.93 TaxID=1442369 RepID=A0A0D2ISH0_9EURO|nr:uncharacterized protein Z518_04055 [Rhinocladiella mackenziei CBS 650.93]KIX06081.1 hypothetical protein Z518_04055 [Rhinocladiella mackenziei CBS 650.93]